MRRFPYGILASGVGIYLILQGLCMGVATIAGSSEAREAQVVSAILRDDRWILPLRNGIIPSKPPLFHWCAAIVSMLCGGVSEFSVRMTSQVAAAVCIILVSAVTYRFGILQRTYQGVGHARRSSLLAAGIVSLTYGFYVMGCQAMVDMTFVATVWSALAALVLGVRTKAGEQPTGEIHRFNRALFWFFVFTAVLARGPLGFVLPIALVTVAGVTLVGVRRTALEFLTPSLGWLACAIPLIWYWKAYQLGGQAFVDRQILFENIKRFSGGDYINSEAWWFYLPSIVRTTFPWGLLLIVVFCREFRLGRSVSYSDDCWAKRWLPTIILCGGVAIFSLSSGKRHSYLLPLLPLIAVQLGIELSSLLERGGVSIRQRLRTLGTRIERSLIWIFIVVLVLLTGTIASGVVSNQVAVQSYTAMSHIVARMSAIIVGITLLIMAWPKRSLSVVCSCAWVLMLAVMTTVVSAGAASKGYWKGFDVMASTWLATIREGERLAVFKHSFDEYFDPLLFYVRRPVDVIPLERATEECESGTVYAAKRTWLEAHEELFQGAIVKVATVRERLKNQAHTVDREIVFFRCSTFAAKDRPQPRSLQDATLDTVERFQILPEPGSV